MLFGIGANGSNPFSLDGLSTSANSNLSNTTVSTGSLSLNDLRVQLRSAGVVLADAFRALTTERKPLFGTTTINTPPVAAKVTGFAGRVQQVDGTSSGLKSTVRVNTQGVLHPTSSSALGLDLTSAVSYIDSELLGLDTTSPASASRLDSSAGLGLDVTSPESASVLASLAALGLDVTSPETASTITSTAEMNTMPTSYQKVHLTFTSGSQTSTSNGTLSGVYSGVNSAASATSLEIESRSNVTVSALVPTIIKFRVHDQNGNQLGDYNVLAKAGDQIYLGDDIGLYLSFSAGTLKNNHVDTTNVSHSPTNVNANSVFNDSDLNLRPRFQGGAQVTAGSFTINGVTIAVNANDTINNVITRINASAAGVTASIASDKITLTTNVVSEDNIVLAGDTSGFLAATKLSSAATVKGNIRDNLQVLSKTTQFAGVSTGSFKINGVSISVNKDTDTLSSIITRINSAGAAVTAAYNAAQDKIVLTTTSNTEDLITVSNDTTGFLTAGKLSTGNTVRGNIRDDIQVFSKTTQFGQVTDGTLTINGQTIAVDADQDTLTTLMAKINNAGAGVTASFNAGTNKIELVGTSNSEDLIVVGNDSSGFLDAAALDTNNTVRGNLADDQQVFSKASQFPGVISGSFSINGHTIALDADQDSVETLIDKINNADIGITASYNAVSDRFRLETEAASEDLIVVSNDTTGFLLSAGIDSSSTVIGKLLDVQDALANVNAFAGVTSGTFKVNNVSIAIDPDTDTVQTVIAKINSSSAGVTAAYDVAADKIVLDSNDGVSPVVLTADTSGFLTASKIVNVVNPDASFNGTGANSVLFDPGLSVHAGSFTVNGVSIAVDAGDSIDSVLAKITESTAGVTASFDAATQKVDLTSKQHTSAPIVVGNDTSGFLSAIKLDGTAQSTNGLNDRSALDVVFGEMTEYSGVHAGVITVNGREVEIDPGQTNLRDLVAAVDAIADLKASVDERTGKIQISSSRTGKPITITDTSGLLSTLHIAPGTARGTPGTSQVVHAETGSVIVSNADFVAAAVSSAAEQLNDTLSQLAVLPGATPDFFSEIEKGIRAAIDSLGDEVAAGLSLTGSGSDLRFDVAVERLEQNLNLNAATLTESIGGPLNAFVEKISAVATSIDLSSAQSASAQAGLKDKIAQFAAQQQASLLVLLQAPPPTIMNSNGSFLKKAADVYQQQQDTKSITPPEFHL